MFQERILLMVNLSIVLLYGRTNLVVDSWNDATNSPGNGSNLVFSLNKDSITNFYRCRVTLPE